MKIIVDDKNEMTVIACAIEAIAEAGEECALGAHVENHVYLGLFQACKWLIAPVITALSDIASEPEIKEESTEEQE